MKDYVPISIRICSLAKNIIRKDINYYRHCLGNLSDFFVCLHNLLDTTLTTDMRG